MVLRVITIHSASINVQPLLRLLSHHKFTLDWHSMLKLIHLQRFPNELMPDDIVLLKASHGIHFLNQKLKLVNHLFDSDEFEFHQISLLIFQLNTP